MTSSGGGKVGAQDYVLWDMQGHAGLGQGREWSSLLPLLKQGFWGWTQLDPTLVLDQLLLVPPYPGPTMQGFSLLVFTI